MAWGCVLLCRTLAMIKPDAVQHLGKILTAVHQAGFTIR
jgi:nucleoside diphosphate kinase